MHDGFALEHRTMLPAWQSDDEVGNAENSTPESASPSSGAADREANVGDLPSERAHPTGTPWDAVNLSETERDILLAVAQAREQTFDQIAAITGIGTKDMYCGRHR
jgi:hypothetical protein